MPNNAKVNDIDKSFFEIKLETNINIKSLAILTIYNCQSAKAINSIIFPIISHICNSNKHVTDNNNIFFTLFYHFI